MTKQQVDEESQQANRRHLYHPSRIQRQDRQTLLSSILKERFFALILVFLCLTVIISFPFLLTEANPSLSVNKPVGSDTLTLFIAAGFSIVFILMWIVVFALICYQIVRFIQRLRNNHPSTSNFRTTYHPSPLVNSTNKSSFVRIRVIEEPLTAQNFSTIISAFTDLHTKCWLIAKGRFTDVIEFSQTHNARLTEEAHLVISKITQNSPVDIKLNVNADASTQGIVEALKIGIDAVTQAPLRHKDTQLSNKAKELEIKIQELQTQAEVDAKAQTRQINAKLAELEIEKQKLEIDRQNVALQKERLEYQIAARDFALETATMMIEQLYPEVDKSTKAMLIRTFIPELLQLGNGKGLELALPAPQVKGDEPIEDQ